MEGKDNVLNNRATKTVASTLGVLVGLAGVEHGYFEFLQGSARPDNILIDAIGPAQRFWEYGTETALTVVPSFRLTGILAMIIGLLVTIWAYAYVDRKAGAYVLLLLSIALFLVGGGFAPIFLTFLAFIAATRINRPLTLWRWHLPAVLRGLVAKLWPWSLIASVLLFIIAVEIAIFGDPLLGMLGPASTFSVQTSLGWMMLVLAIAALPAANAHDAKRAANLSH